MPGSDVYVSLAVGYSPSGEVTVFPNSPRGREMLKGKLADLLFAEKCCIFALQDRGFPAQAGLSRFLFAPFGRKTGRERGSLSAL